MKKQRLLGLAVLPFLANVALATQPLSNQQMDAVIAAGTLTNAEGQPVVAYSCLVCSGLGLSVQPAPGQTSTKDGADADVVWGNSSANFTADRLHVQFSVLKPRG